MMVLPGTGRFGVATARAIGNTPRRNAVKRRIREAWRLTDGRPPAWDVVLSAKARAAEASLKELQDEVAKLLDEARARWGDGSVSL
jgi:ribonuclease P protein component